MKEIVTTGFIATSEHGYQVIYPSKPERIITTDEFNEQHGEWKCNIGDGIDLTSFGVEFNQTFEDEPIEVEIRIDLK